MVLHVLSELKCVERWYWWIIERDEQLLEAGWLIQIQAPSNDLQQVSGLQEHTFLSKMCYIVGFLLFDWHYFPLVKMFTTNMKDCKLQLMDWQQCNNSSTSLWCKNAKNLLSWSYLAQYSICNQSFCIFVWTDTQHYTDLLKHFKQQLPKNMQFSFKTSIKMTSVMKKTI